MEKEQRGKNDMKELQRRKDEFKANWQEYQGKITKFEKREIQREEMLRQENMDLQEIEGRRDTFDAKKPTYHTKIIQQVHQEIDRKKKAQAGGGETPGGIGGEKERI